MERTKFMFVAHPSGPGPANGPKPVSRAERAIIGVASLAWVNVRRQLRGHLRDSQRPKVGNQALLLLARRGPVIDIQCPGEVAHWLALSVTRIRSREPSNPHPLPSRQGGHISPPPSTPPTRAGLASGLSAETLVLVRSNVGTQIERDPSLT